jgi:DNA-binding MarR family transcriptional regulator
VTVTINQSDAQRLKNSFLDVFDKIKLLFYRRIFARFERREASLTAVETFSVEVIHSLGEPTISEFADFVGISPENAAYKIKNLIKKDYMRKIQSANDHREFHLQLTERYAAYQRLYEDSIALVMRRVQARITPAEIATCLRVLDVLNDELNTIESR